MITLILVFVVIFYISGSSARREHRNWEQEQKELRKKLGL